MSLHISDAVIWQETAGGISLYHTETGEFRTLNDSGAKIWVLVAGDGEREQVAAKLALLFAGHNTTIGARIRAEVDEFIGTMIEAGLLDEAESGTESEAESGTGTEAGTESVSA